MTDTVLEGVHEMPQHAERYFATMEDAIEFTRWITPAALAINPVNFKGEMLYQLIYQWKDGDR